MLIVYSIKESAQQGDEKEKTYFALSTNLFINKCIPKVR